MVCLGLDVPHGKSSIKVLFESIEEVRKKKTSRRRRRKRKKEREVELNQRNKEEPLVLLVLIIGDSMLCCGRRKDQGRDIPPNAEPAASPRRLQLGQIASTLQPSGRVGGPGPNATNKDFPHMVLQPDFRKVSGISTEIFRQLEAVENDHDATTAAALGAVERRGEMLVRMLNPRQFSRSVQGTVQKFLNMQDALHAVHFVEIVKRPGQTLGLYIREGNGLDRYDGVFISRIAIESAVFNSGCLGVGDEILAVNLVDVTHMSLDDVVILMSIPRRLVLTIRQQKGQRIMTGGGDGVSASGPQSILRSQSKLPPVVVIKKELEEQDQFDESNGENGPIHHHHQYMSSHQYYSAGHGTAMINHYANLPQGIHSLGRGRGLNVMTASHPPGGRMFSTGPGMGRAGMQQQQQQQQQQAPHSIQSLPRHGPYQPSYANLGLQPGLPDVAADYARITARHDDFRLDGPQAPIRRPHFADYYDQMRPEPPPRPSSQQGAYMERHDIHGPSSARSYDWYRASTADRMIDHHHHPPPGHHQHHPSHQHQPHQTMGSSLPHETSASGGRDMSTASVSYQPPPPVITEQPRSVVPAHFQPFDRAYPKTLESLAEKVHTFYTGPRPSRQGGRSSLRIPRTGSDHRLGSRTDQQLWYGSMPRQRSSDYRSLSLQPQPMTPGQQAQQSVSARYSQALSSRLGGLPTSRRKQVLDYASDSEATAYTPSLRSAGLSLPASTRRSLGLTNGRSNSLPRDFIRGRGGRKQGVRFDRRGGPDLTSSLAGRRALLLSAGIHSEDESDGAASAPEMPTPRRERGRIPSSPSVFTSAEYRAWLTRAPSTSAIYERLKTNRDSELIQTQKAAKLTFSAENLSLLDRARNRAERYAKILTEPTPGAGGVDRGDNQSNLTMWEARLRTQEQPYYSYRSHLMATGLTGGDSTLARALAGARTPSSTLQALGIGQSPLREGVPGTAKDQMRTPTDSLGRLVMTPSRSRDLISPFTSGATAAGVVSTTSTGITIDPTGGRTTPSSYLRMTIEKDSESIRKEILSRSLMTRDMLPARDRDTLKEELEEKTEKIASRLSHVAPSVTMPGAPQSILRTTSHLTGSSTTSSTTTPLPDSRLKLLTINPSEFLRYKIERPSSAASDVTTNGVGTGQQGHSGILRVHLLAGRALRSTVRSTDSSIRTRDLYCVLECDRVHKARTVVCTGDQNFDWDEVFELDLVNNKELDFLIYSWDPQLRHRLCYKGSVNLLQVLNDPPGATATHQLAIKVEPRGTLYVKLKHTPPQEAFKRELKSGCLFGGDVATVVMKEDSGLNVPLIVQRCIEEIERRGLDIIGLYRLCGSATKKQTLREAFERSPRIVDLSAENVPDINVIAGVLKDYLREMPEPLLTKCLYQMLVDALGVCLPDDPEGNARLLFSIIECLPKPNRCTLLLILEHLSLVCSLSDRNKMGPMQLAGSFGPILMVHFDGTPESLDFQPPIKILQYLLEVWPAKSVTLLQTVRAVGAEAVRKGPSQLGQGRQFPRSSPASILSSRSQKTHPSKTLLHLSPSKASPGSLSESSPSPTSIHSSTGPAAAITSGSGLTSATSVTAKQVTTSSIMSSTTASAVTTTIITTSSSSSGVLTLTPSTTSSSLTSVTTPNSLTPVSATAKSIAPATTSSNYSLTSEFSTTSITSPTPGMKGSDTNEELFATVSVRSRVSAFEQSTTTTTTPAGRTVENLEGISILTTATVSSTISYPTAYTNGELTTGQQLFQSQLAQQQYQQQQQAQEQQYQQYQAQQLQAQQEAQQQYQQFQQQQYQRELEQQQYQQQREQQQYQRELETEQYLQQREQQQHQRELERQQYHQQLEEEQQKLMEQERKDAEEAAQKQSKPPVPPSPFMGRKLPPGPGRVERADSLEERGPAKRKLPPLPPSFSHPDMPAPPGSAPPQHSEQSRMYSEQRSQSLDQPSESRRAAVPPPPPPKPAASRIRRELMDEQSRSQSEDESPVQEGASDSRRSSIVEVQPGRQGNNSNVNNSQSNNVWSSSVTSSSTSTPTTVQSQSNSKGSSPGPATPLSTPPPVPPRLDRRPSQPSPTSSPPSMPPPVPPRLGRAAPVRTPSLDGRDAFEVDCYTIKEENGEEDYLT